MNIYLTGLYGVGKQYIGFQYGTKFAEQTVSFLYMNSFGGLEHQLRFFFFPFFVCANIACFILLREGQVLAFDIVAC